MYGIKHARLRYLDTCFAAAGHSISILHWEAGNSGYDGDIIISVQQLLKVLYFSKCQSKTKEILETSRRNYISLSKKLLLLCGAWCWWWWRDGGAVFALP